MTTSPSRPLTPGRVLPCGRRVLSFAPLALLLAVALVGCATLAPGEDPVVVRTEQVLKMAVPVYDSAMGWYFDNAARLTPGAKSVFERVRVSFPPVYRSLDSALQLYKAGKRKEVMAEFDELQRLVVEMLSVVKALGGPDLAGGAK